ncbi:alpha/beta hydrolase [Microbacterium sp. 22303]|uniref:alpha/beta hydrolase n=1 Tax=Microbacterium sp. 22303 TaxID=3453905 RepID=UPI003F82D4C1
MTESPLHMLRMNAASSSRGSIFAVHGLAESADTLRPLAAAWASAGFDVVRVDLRGHGGSARWADSAASQHPGDVIADDLTVALESCVVDLQLPRFAYGHSAGGAVIATVADHPALFSGVLLEDPFWRLPPTRYQERRAAAAAVDDLVLLQHANLEARRTIGRGRFPRWTDDEIDAWARAKAETDPWIVENGDIIPTRPWPELLATVTRAGVPVRILTGTDRIGMTAAHRELAVECGATYAVAPDAGHFVRRDAPEWFLSESLRFFASVP